MTEKIVMPDLSLLSDDLISNHYFGDLEIFVKVAKAYFLNCSRDFSILESATIKKNSSEVARLAHLIKGSVGNFYCYQLTNQFKDLEQAGKDNNINHAIELFNEIQPNFVSFNKDLEELLNDTLIEIRE